MANQHASGHQGTVKDPEHDGRLKQNREAGRTKGTTPGSEARREGHDPEGGSHGGQHAAGGERTTHASRAEGGDDVKGREYTDAEGKVHHHTKAYMEQHKGE